MDLALLKQLASLVRTRNAVAQQITQITGRPAHIGHVGEFIAAQVFDVALEASAANKGFDGRFRGGPLVGRTVNIKWYAKREGLLDLRLDALPDFYLVLTGPAGASATSVGEDRPWRLEAVYLFYARALMEALARRRVTIGTATSVAQEYWQAAEVYPSARGGPLSLGDEQREALALFSATARSPDPGSRPEAAEAGTAAQTSEPRLGERFFAALDYAARKHRDQARKGPDPVPYVAHLLGVAAIVLEDGGSEDEAIAALLHDAVEDQGGRPTRAEIAQRFGEPVTQIVDGCTDADVSPKPPWRPRKEAHLRHLASAAPSVIRVSLADKLYNAQETLLDLKAEGEAVWTRFKVGRAEQLWYYRSLVDVFGSRRGADDVLVGEFARVVDELGRT